MAETTDIYYTLEADSEAEYTEKRSRFLAFAVRVDSDTAAKEKVAAYKKTYYNARHVCFAYVLGERSDYSRSNDDGEPSGTAGKPILSQILKAQLTFTLVVVVRYYGGTPLGAANLGRAYKLVAEEALAKARKKTNVMTTAVRVECDYPDTNIVESAAKQFDVAITGREYLATTLRMKLAVPLSVEPLLDQHFSKFYTITYKREDDTTETLSTDRL